MQSLRTPRSTLACVQGALIAALHLTIITTAHSAGPPEYEMVLLETFPDDSIAHATAINNEGEITGYSRGPGEPYRAWVRRGDELIDLGNLGGAAIQLWDISEQGHVIGHGGGEDNSWIPFLWSDGAFDFIPTHGGPNGVAFGLNENDLVCGHSQIELPLGHYQAFVWEDGVLVNLGTLGGGNSGAYAINNDGVVAGFATNADIEARAVVWIDHVAHELEHPEGVDGSVAYDINEQGVCVGTVGPGEWYADPVIWIDGELGYRSALPGQLGCVQWGMNEFTESVGWANLGEFDTVATLWWGAAVYDLNDLIVIGPEHAFAFKAYDINEQREIVGTANVDGFARAMLLRPIPIVGDLDGDWSVSVTDLLLLLGAWGPCPDPPDPCPADLDGSGAVDVLDLLILLGNWG